MTNWTLETLEDFDGVRFDDGTGWKVLFEIHLALSLRIQMVSSAYGSPFATQISGLMWTQDGPGGSAGELSMELTACYNAIVSLLGGPVTELGGLRWTEASGRSPEWTIESLTADIGMGEFADLIVRSQRPEPLVWLIAAISRLQYPKIWRKLYFNDYVWVPSNITNFGQLHHMLSYSDIDAGAQTSVYDDIETRLQQAWSTLGSLTPYPDWAITAAVAWSVSDAGSAFPNYRSFALEKCTNISLAAKMGTGSTPFPGGLTQTEYKKPLTIKCLDYQYALIVWHYNGPDFVVKMGSSPETNIGHAYTAYNQNLFLESEGADLDWAGTQSVSLELLTERPATVPFSVFWDTPSAQIGVSVKYAWVYCDLPQIMGVGELIGPAPAVSGIAEQEE